MCPKTLVCLDRGMSKATEIKLKKIYTRLLVRDLAVKWHFACKERKHNVCVTSNFFYNLFHVKLVLNCGVQWAAYLYVFETTNSAFVRIGFFRLESICIYFSLYYIWLFF